MSKRKKNLELLGAWVCGALLKTGDVPLELARLLDDAELEITKKLEKKQYRLWQRTGDVKLTEKGFE